jgi:serine/tyrosine/threonine adenylyltransferase
MNLMIETTVDYTIFFRELSNIPEDISKLEISFYKISEDEKLKNRWTTWLDSWKSKLNYTSEQLKAINPKYTLREWFLVEAYEKAYEGNYSLIHELQEIMTKPYDEQSKEIEEKFYMKKPLELFNIAGVSHVSCSS